MKKLLLLFAVFVHFSCSAQTSKTNSTTPRFMILQSTIAVRFTFKLDTYTGDVYQMVVDKDDKTLWQLMYKERTTLADTRYPDANNYSLFLSTMGVRHTFLINNNTGATWKVVEDSETKALFFTPMVDH